MTTRNNFTQTSINIPEEIFGIAQKNPFRETNNRIEGLESRTKNITVAAAASVKAMVVSAIIKSSPFPPKIAK